MSSALRLGLSRPAAAAASHTATTARTFSSTPAALKLKIPTGNWRQRMPRDREDDPIPIPKPYAKDAHIPPYPYGPRTTYKQSNAGLYGLARIRFGNNVSPKHNVKTPRKWRPNVHRKSLWSMALGCWVQTRMTMRVLRTIDKVGGLDSYLLGTKPMRIKELGPWGWKLRWRIMQSPVIKKQFREQRRVLGLPPTQEELDEDILREIQEAEALRASEMQGAGTMELDTTPASADALTRDGLMAEIDGMLESGEEFPFGSEEDLTLESEDSTEQEDLSAEQDDIASKLEDLNLGPGESSPGPESMASGIEKVDEAPLEDTSATPEDLTASRSEPSLAQKDLSTAPENLTAPGLEDLASVKAAPEPEATSKSEAASDPEAASEPKAGPGPDVPKDEGFMKEEKP